MQKNQIENLIIVINILIISKNDKYYIKKIDINFIEKSIVIINNLFIK